MLAWMLASAALAVDCPELPGQVEEAWEAYNEAELERAKVVLKEAYDSLGCQRAVVDSKALLELYRLDALVSLTQEDRKGAVYATLRAVAVDHLRAEPPAEYGPELADLYALWSTRLGETLVTVTVTDGGVVWIDGRRVEHGHPLAVVSGEHLLQVENLNGMRSEVRELSVDQALVTGVPLPEGVTPMPVVPAPRPTREDPPVEPGPEIVEPPIDPEPRRRKRPALLLVGGGVLGAAGGAAIGVAYQGEQAFLGRTYNAAEYGGCARGEPCYGAARLDAVARDADRVRVTYLVGYGLTGVGAALLGVGLVGLPVRTDGRTVGVHLRW